MTDSKDGDNFSANTTDGVFFPIVQFEMDTDDSQTQG